MSDNETHPVELEDNGAELRVYALPLDKQTFVWAILDGQNQTDAYLTVSPTMSRTNATKMGSRWATRIDVRSAIDELLEQRAQAARRVLLGAAEKAAKRLVSTLDTPDGDRAARDILDRIGLIARHGLDVRPGGPSELDELLAS